MVTEVNKIIYVVTSGKYSDYEIEAVYDNYETAHKAAMNSGYECRVEEYQLNKPSEDNRVVWKIRYCKDNDSWSSDYAESWPLNYNSDEVRQENIKGSWNAGYIVTTRTFYTTYVRAINRDAALKIANEKIMMAIAGGR